jgi:hypothetical protein
VRAQTTFVLQHAGTLLGEGDVPVAGAVSLTFRIYAAETAHEGEVDLWHATYEVQAFNGVYSVEMGRTGADPLAPELFPGNAPRYLAIAVGGGTEMSPRLKIGMAPLAMNAMRLGGRPAADFAIASEVTAAIAAITPQAIGAEPADADLQAHLLDTQNPHGVTPAQIGAEPADADIQIHLAATNNPHAVTAAQVGLGNVENTKLSTWAGSSELTTVGTLSAGAVPTTLVTGALTDGSVHALHKHAAVHTPSGAAALRVDASGNVGIGGSGAPLALLDIAGAVKIGNSSVACDPDHAGMLRWNGATFLGCNGSAWIAFAAIPGLDQASAARSCKSIKDAYPSAADGKYWIDPAGGDTSDAFEIWCDMTTDGGGWTTIANTLKPNNDSNTVLTTSIADLKIKDPLTNNHSTLKWAGPKWTELLVECRHSSASDTPARWIFVRSQQIAAVQTGFDDFIENGNTHSAALGTSGNNACYAKNEQGTTRYCGHNNNGSESDWGDGFQIGSATPNWSYLLFGSTDSQNYKKCNQTSGYSHAVTTGNMGANGIYTFRIR